MEMGIQKKKKKLKTPKMKPVLKRYIFESGLDVIAPLKCGTRWLESLDIDNRTHRIGFHLEELKKNVHSGTTFIWRPVREHFVSALQTELATTEKELSDIVDEMEAGLCDHWYPHLYSELYSIWSETPFRFHKLRALSELTPSASDLEWSPTMYAFSLPTKWDSVESVLNSLSPKHLIRLEKLIGDEDKWLKSMLKSQYSEKSWEEYSDLEDKALEEKIKRIEMENEVNRVTNSKWVKEFQTTIRELMESNTKLEAKIKYAESLLGRKANKLI